jgi:uncharacterized protein YgiM (DUF1202 family)
MAKKILKKAQDGITATDRINPSQQANMDVANQAALEKVRALAVNRYDPDTMYAASKADADAQYAKDLEKFRNKNKLAKPASSRFSTAAKKAVKNLTSELGRSKVGGAITDMGKLQAYYKGKK